MKRPSLHTFALTILLATAGAAGAQETPATDINPPVLKVNDEIIYAAEVSMVMGNIAGQLAAQNRDAPDQQQLVQMATQRVVEQKLLSQEATRLGYKPNDLRVAEMMAGIEQQSGGREKLEQSLSVRGSSYDRLVVTVKEMDLTRTLVEKQITPGITVTAEEIAAFHNENPGMFSTPEQVHARHILITVDQNADADTIIAARASADSARERALAGGDFAELARELSQDPSAPEGGDLGFFTYQQMPPAFADAAFALQPGGISEVVRTSYGFHVIKVEEKKPAAESTLDESSARIRQLLTQKKTGEQVQELLRSLAETAVILPLVAPDDATGSPEGGATPG